MIGIWREGNQVTAAVLKSGVEVKRGRIVNASSPHEALTDTWLASKFRWCRARARTKTLLSQVPGHWHTCRTGISGSALLIAKAAI